MSGAANGSPPAVTVYVANYNYGRFIARALDSLLAQTRRDIEILVIDDGSADDSRTVIESYAQAHGIIPIFQQNRGLTVTNNIALRMARGRYLMRLDADDWLDPHAIEVLAGTLDRAADVDMVFPDYWLADADGAVLEVVRRHDFADVTLMDQPAHGACTMLRTEVLRSLGGYDETLPCQDGYDLWVRFVQRHRVQNVSIPLFYYRQHGSSLTRNEQRILDTRARILAKAAARQDAQLATIGVIPVRGRAADPRSTALRRLGGRPLLDWTIEAALAARRLSAVLVTTPDEEILEHVARRWAGQVQGIRRPRTLSALNSFADDAVRHAVQHWAGEGAPPDAVAMLFIESPFRTGEAIDTAIDVLAVFGTDSVLSVRPETDTFYTHDGGGLRPVRSGRMLRLEAEELFRRCGDIEVVRWPVLGAAARSPDERVGHVIVDEAAALCLTSEHAWQIAEALLRERASQAAQ